MGLADGKYILVTTFRRDGTPAATPTWVVPLDGDTVGFHTSSGSGKAKRLAHTPRVTVQPCNARGRVTAGTAPVEATARVVEGAERDAIVAKVAARYGFMNTVAKAFESVAGIVKRKHVPYADRAVVITPKEPTP